jgi:hypothetical protein
MTPAEQLAYLLARADQLDREAAEHREGHARRESASVRAKKRAQARELRRCVEEMRGRRSGADVGQVGAD